MYQNGVVCVIELLFLLCRDVYFVDCILVVFQSPLFVWTSDIFGHTANTGYILLQYSVTVYANDHIHLMMALCGRNMSLNVHERMDLSGH
jgi:hypothetical protein